MIINNLNDFNKLYNIYHKRSLNIADINGYPKYKITL